MFGAFNTEPGDDGGFKRTFYVDANVFFRGRYPVPLEHGFFELYAGLPVGFSALIPSDDAGTDAETQPGWNIGLLAGMQYFFGGPVGVMAEMGWLRHEWINSDSPTEITGTTNQFVLNLGIAFLLGS
jgi:hypothetical protein